MKHSSNFLIAFAAALLTFGTLTLTVGPRHFGWRDGDRHGYQGHYGENHSCYHDNGKTESEKNNSTPDETQQ